MIDIGKNYKRGESDQFHIDNKNGVDIERLDNGTYDIVLDEDSPFLVYMGNYKTLEETQEKVNEIQLNLKGENV